jgi:hypothetical protein
MIFASDARSSAATSDRSLRVGQETECVTCAPLTDKAQPRPDLTSTQADSAAASRRVRMARAIPSSA